jgi:polyisoprenoid-binding protein YceI
MKIFGIIILVGVLIVGYILVTSEKPPEDLQSAVVNETLGVRNEADGETNAPTKQEAPISSLDFTFTGFGPGKSHVGTFDDIKINDLAYDDSGLTGGEIRIAVKSINTTPVILHTHLCADNFFDCENHEEIVFTITGTEGQTVSGDLTIKDTTKTISFDAELSEDGGSIAADFKIDVDQFGFSGPGVNKEVQITFKAIK